MAAVYYLDPVNGSDANDGSSLDSAFKTPDALTKLPAGSNVKLAYNEYRGFRFAKGTPPLKVESIDHRRTPFVFDPTLKAALRIDVPGVTLRNFSADGRILTLGSDLELRDFDYGPWSGATSASAAADTGGMIGGPGVSNQRFVDFRADGKWRGVRTQNFGYHTGGSATSAEISNITLERPLFKDIGIDAISIRRFNNLTLIEPEITGHERWRREEHPDFIQATYGGKNLRIISPYFHDNTEGWIILKDGLVDGVYLANGLGFNNGQGAFDFSNVNNATVVNNTFPDRTLNFGLSSGQYSKGLYAINNIQAIKKLSTGSGFTATNNLSGSQVTFAGPDDYRLAPTSAGVGSGLFNSVVPPVDRDGIVRKAPYNLGAYA